MTTKALDNTHVQAMVKALRAAKIPVKKDALGYEVSITNKTTGKKKTIFRALRGKGHWLVTHDENLFLAN